MFYRLRWLHPGDHAVVRRAGGATSTFTVETLQRQPKTAPPVRRIWNPTTNPVRLITCGGSFDATAATMSSSTQA